MSEVWLTHPNLTPDHDVKVPRAAVGTTYGPSGWVIREDQSDPVEELDEPDAELADDHHEDAGDGDEETPAADVVPDENDEHETEEGS